MGERTVIRGSALQAERMATVRSGGEAGRSMACRGPTAKMAGAEVQSVASGEAEPPSPP